MRLLIVATASLLSALVTVGVAQACQSSGKILLQDQFKYFSKGWGRYPNYHVVNGEFVITPPAKFDTAALNSAALPEDIEICVTFSFKPPADVGECAGIALWGSDYDNYYSFQVSNDGQAAFWRRQRGRWLNQLKWTPVASVKKGDVAINEMRVTIRGSRVRLFINDEFFTEIIGEPAKGARKIGLLACAANKSAAIVAFDDLLVTPPSEPADQTPKQ
jgi:hypothetical protein